MGYVRIISYSSETFSDRAEAGRLLAEALDEYKGHNPVVLGIPRGGLIVARELAPALDAELRLLRSARPLTVISSHQQGPRKNWIASDSLVCR